jgi:hypothetical protein
MFNPATLSSSLAGRLIIQDNGVDAKGKQLVKVTVNNFDRLDELISTARSGAREEYCPNIMCSSINADKTHSLVITRLNDMEGDYDDRLTLKQTPVTTSLGSPVTVKGNYPPLYTALYLAYLYRINKAPKCPTGGVAGDPEQCKIFIKSGVSRYAQRFGGGKTRRRRARRASRKALKRRGSRKH